MLEGVAGISASPETHLLAHTPQMSRLKIRRIIDQDYNRYSTMERLTGRRQLQLSDF